MRALLAVGGVLAVALAGCGSDEQTTSTSTSASGTTALEVVLDYDGDGPGKRVVLSSVSCDGPDDKPGAAGMAACAAVAEVQASDFEPVDPNTACTEIFGGPETVTITGLLRGQPLRGEFSRANGCEIERWEAISPLLEVAYPDDVLNRIGP